MCGHRQGNRDRIVGVKVRQTWPGRERAGASALGGGRGGALGLPAMVRKVAGAHAELAQLLRPGDIITIPSTVGPAGSGRRGQVIPNWEAADRGIIFDVGHGAGSFSFR